MNTQLQLLPEPVLRARMDEAWRDEEARSTGFLDAVQGAPMCQIGVSIYMQHDFGRSGQCRRCGWEITVWRK